MLPALNRRAINIANTNVRTPDIDPATLPEIGITRQRAVRMIWGQFAVIAAAATGHLWELADLVKVFQKWEATAKPS